MDEIYTPVIRKLSHFKRSTTLQTAAMNVLVKLTSSSEYKDVDALRSQFHAIDRTGSGTISMGELKEILERKKNLKLSQEDIDNIIS